MSEEESGTSTPPTTQLPRVAKRVGDRDTLYSAPWFAGQQNIEAPTEEKKSYMVPLILFGIAGFVIVGAGLCASGGAFFGAWYAL